jgi:hypothetical protein
MRCPQRVCCVCLVPADAFACPCPSPSHTTQPPEQLQLRKDEVVLEDAKKLADLHIENDDVVAMCYALAGACVECALDGAAAASAGEQLVQAAAQSLLARQRRHGGSKLVCRLSPARPTHPHVHRHRVDCLASAAGGGGFEAVDITPVDAPPEVEGGDGARVQPEAA